MKSLHQISKRTFRVSYLTLAFFAVLGMQVFAQDPLEGPGGPGDPGGSLAIDGDIDVVCGTSHQYAVSGGTGTVTWEAFGGTITSSTNTLATVLWTGAYGTLIAEIENSTFLPAIIGVTLTGPEAPTVISTSGCPNTVILLTASTSVKWYDSSTEGIHLSTGMTYQHSGTTSKTVYAAVANGTCESLRVAATATVSNCGAGVPMLNYVQDYTVQEPGHTTLQNVLDQTTPEEVLRNRAYSDGLGRGIQAIAWQATPDKKDLATATEYDDLGRVLKQWLPFKSTEDDGKYKSNKDAQRNAFFLSQYGGTDDGYAYSQSETDNSPMNRVVKQMAPGAAWVGDSKGVEMNYRTNTASEYVVSWSAGPGETDVPTNGGYYAPEKLSVTETTDEQGQKVLQYTDFLGRVVLKKVQEATSPSANHTGWLSTYYVYDTYGNLKTVISPKAVALISNDWNISSTESDELLFHYAYGDRNRMISKKVPGAGKMEMVYDQQDRLVLSRDGNQNSLGEWTYTKYDHLSRPIMTGIYSSTASRSTLQTAVNGYGTNSMTASENPPATIVADYIYLSHHNPDITTYSAVSGIEFLNGFDSDDNYFETNLDANPGTTTTSYIDGYTDGTYPPLGSDVSIESISYYDNYSFTDKAFTSTYNAAMTGGGGSYEEVPDAIENVTGLPTGSRIKVLGQDQWLETVSFYDRKGRVVQVRSGNQNGGEDIVTNKYDFSGKVLYTYLHHSNPLADDFSEIRIIKRMTYDHAGRLTHVKHRNVNQESTYQTIVQNTYDALGQLTQKALGDNKQYVDHTYNIRGWLKSINDAQSLGSDYFAMDLKYNDASQATDMFNGNIAEVEWKSVGDAHLKRYEYSYDKSNRLKTASYDNLTNNTFDDDFSVSGINYDENGNIQALQRRGRVLTSAQVIDNLDYDYNDSEVSNQLRKVTDDGVDGKIGDFMDGSNASTEYTYDANGNMLTDLNKGISSNISYNRFNLPELVDMGGGRTINYRYDAAGIKLQKITNDNGTLVTTDYINGFIYQNNNLQQFAHEEGRVRKNDQGSLVYDYTIKDHLGNSRVTFTTETNVVNVYKATMESGNDTEGNSIKAFEEQLFFNLNETRSSVGGSAANKSTTADDGCTSCGETALTNGLTQPVGPAILLDVMPNDEIDLEVWAYYENPISTSTQRINTTSIFISTLANAFVPGGSSELLTQTNSLFNGVSGYVTGGGGSGTTRPFAFLNYIVFDSNFIRIKSGHKRVNYVVAEKHLLSLNNVNITQKGYVYIWVSNESNEAQNTFFDDLKVTHHKGDILQEDHYYPFGANIAALSSTAPLSKPNNYKFNGNEEQTDFDINIYDFNARMYDANLGRFMNIDPLADQFTSYTPYHFTRNNPISRLDPSGLSDEDVNKPDPEAEEWKANFFAKGDAFAGHDRNQTSIAEDREAAGILSPDDKSDDSEDQWFMKDKQGKTIFEHWRKGNGEELLLGGKEWSDYLLNATLRSIIIDFLRKNDTGQRTKSGNFFYTLAGLTGENGYQTGRGLLNGTNENVGGLQISGYANVVTEDIVGTRVVYTLSVVWNDIIDANNKYLADQILRSLYSGTDYNIRIYMNTSLFISKSND